MGPSPKTHRPSCLLRQHGQHYQSKSASSAASIVNPSFFRRYNSSLCANFISKSTVSFFKLRASSKHFWRFRDERRYIYIVEFSNVLLIRKFPELAISLPFSESATAASKSRICSLNNVHLHHPPHCHLPHFFLPRQHHHRRAPNLDLPQALHRYLHPDPPRRSHHVLQVLTISHITSRSRCLFDEFRIWQIRINIIEDI